ncbi:hypothetical protein GQ53DRAFT_612925, partial [Thozetella sp. PMI_491]
QRFACPYFKRNPRKYSRVTTCLGPGWTEIHRVKQVNPTFGKFSVNHLHRRHALPPQCPRCWEAFETDSSRDAHLREDSQCEKRDNNTLLEGFTRNQERQLRSRKRTDKNMTDADRWREIYRILFPDDDQSTIPNPYHEEVDLFSMNNPCSCGREDFAKFMRREFPQFVRRELEGLFQGEFRNVEESLRPAIRDIVLRLQPGIVALYRSARVPES